MAVLSHCDSMTTMTRESTKVSMAHPNCFPHLAVEILVWHCPAVSSVARDSLDPEYSHKLSSHLDLNPVNRYLDCLSFRLEAEQPAICNSNNIAVDSLYSFDGQVRLGRFCCDRISEHLFRNWSSRPSDSVRR